MTSNGVVVITIRIAPTKREGFDSGSAPATVTIGVMPPGRSAILASQQIIARAYFYATMMRVVLDGEPFRWPEVVSDAAFGLIRIVAPSNRDFDDIGRVCSLLSVPAKVESILIPRGKSSWVWHYIDFAKAVKRIESDPFRAKLLSDRGKP